MFAEQQPADARNVVALLPTPGIESFEGIGLGTGPVWAINDDDPGAIYVVSGTHFWLVQENSPGNWGATDLGDIGTPTGAFSPDSSYYTIAVGTTAVVVCSPPNAFVSVGGGPVAQITTTWPAYGASSVAYLDGYFVFTAQQQPQFFFISLLNNPTIVDALDFAALDAFPNAIFKVMTLGTDLWFAGGSGWEIWYDAGNVDFPFRRRANGFIQRSVGSGKSIAKGDESLFWWSNDNRIYRTSGYTEKRISTHAIEQSLSAGITSAYVYNLLGHIHYVLNLADRTVVYDTVTGAWHNASSRADGTGPWRPSCCTAYTGVPIMGDSLTGDLLQADQYLSTDNSIEPLRQVVLPPIYGGTKRAFCARLEVEMEVGTVHSPPNVVLDWSDDGGITWTGGPRTMLVGSASNYRVRVYTTRLGSFRQRVFRLTAQHAFSVYGIDCDITVGNH